jgi:hypothetical protein
LDEEKSEHGGLPQQNRFGSIVSQFAEAGKRHSKV